MLAGYKVSMNTIHSTALIDDNVELGNNNEILPYTVLKGPLKIGDNNLIGPHVVIGSPGQDTRNPRYDSSNSQIEIGSNNIIREFTAIQKPAYDEKTIICDDVFLMHCVHVPHDAILESKVACAPMVVLGGLSRMMEGAFIGMGSTIHQYSVIGPYSIVATGAAATKNVKPFSRFIPGQSVSLNKYAIHKYGFDEYYEEIERYVLAGEKPQSAIVSEIINRYEHYHLLSKREQY